MTLQAVGDPAIASEVGGARFIYLLAARKAIRSRLRTTANSPATDVPSPISQRRLWPTCRPPGLPPATFLASTDAIQLSRQEQRWRSRAQAQSAAAPDSHFQPKVLEVGRIPDNQTDWLICN